MADYSYDLSEQNEWITRFGEQRERIQAELFEGETIKQCLDTESFGGRLYNPQWIITSEARLWSLARNHNAGGWNTPYPHESTRRWYMKNNWHETTDRLGLDSEAIIYHHQIVANYFCDKKAIYLFGEENCVPHHLFKYLNLFDNHIVQTKQEACTWNNRANHLRWVTKVDHAVLSFIQDPKNSRLSIEDALEEMQKGIKYTDPDTHQTITIQFPESIEALKEEFRDVLQNGRFETHFEDENGDLWKDENGQVITEYQWTALWYEYNDALSRKLHAMGFTLTRGEIPYIR